MSEWRAANLPWLNVPTVELRFVLIAVSNAAEIHSAVSAMTITSCMPACVSLFNTNAIHSQAAVFGSSPDQASQNHSICCHQSTVTMGFRAGFTSSKLTLFPRSGTTSRTMDGEYLFCGKFFFHGAFNRTFDVSFRRPIVRQKLSVDFPGGDFANNLRLRVGLAVRTP
jgi:hypothetical protein